MPDPVTPEQLAELRRLAAKATPRPWTFTPEDVLPAGRPGTVASCLMSRNDPPFLALAANLALPLADALEAVTRERDEARALCREVACCGVEHEDPRISYVVVQIDRGMWDELQALRAAGGAA